VSVRDLLQTLSRVHRDRSIWEAFTFTILFAVFLGLSLMLHRVDLAFSTTDALQDLLLDEEFSFNDNDPAWARNMNSPYKKNFFEVNRLEEINQWIRGPLLSAIHPELYYNDQPTQALRRPYILDSQTIVGTVRLRQARVRPDSCNKNRLVSEPSVIDGQVLPKFDTRDGTCFAEYSEKTKDTSPIVGRRTGYVYRYESGMSQVDGLTGYTGGPYGTGGYRLFMSTRNVTQASNIVQQVQDDMWIDRGTRSMVVDFSMYSSQTRLLTVIRISFEFFQTGQVVRYARFLPIPTFMYSTAQDMFRAALEVLFVLLVAYITAIEIWKVARDRSISRYFSSVSTFVDLIFLILAYCFIGSYVIFLTMANQEDLGSPRDDSHFRDMWDFASTFYMATAFAGWLGLVSFLRMFAFLGISKRMQTVWATLDRSKTDLLTFLVGVGMVVMGFSALGHFLYGSRLSEWHNYASSLSSLLRFALGDANYDRMYSVRPQLTPVYFSAYTAIVFLVALNLIIGIVSEAFDATYDELKTSDRWKGTVISLEEDMQAECNICHLRTEICMRSYLFFCCCPLVVEDEETIPDHIEDTRDDW